ncbi:DUF3606 domain-containing protein [Elizabethkingia anophelis]|nr:DUF3606 domain-containing protein [Elizabethkingia anophelis]
MPKETNDFRRFFCKHKKINPDESSELEYWSKMFDVTKECLKKTFKTVETSADRI